MYLNRVLLIGNLTRNPDLKRTQSGQSVCEFSIATNRTTKTNDGQIREEVCFVDIVVWGKQAEASKKFLSKGRSVYIEGRLSFEKWESEDGGRKSRLRVVAEKISFIGGGRHEETGERRYGRGDEPPRRTGTESGNEQ